MKKLYLEKFQGIFNLFPKNTKLSAQAGTNLLPGRLLARMVQSLAGSWKIHKQNP